MTDDRFRDWDAAYVLGSLSADDRRAYEHHLAACPACSTSVVELAGLPGILGKIGRDEAVAMLGAPADDNLRGMHRPDLVAELATSARRRRRTRMTAVAASLGIAALLTIGGFLAGATLAPGVDVAEPALTAEPTADTLVMDQVTSGVMTATLRLTEKPWGTRLDWTCTYNTDGWDPGAGTATYAMVVIDEAGIETTVATWDATGEGAVSLVASTSVPTSAIRTVEIRWLESGTTLVRSDL